VLLAGQDFYLSQEILQRANLDRAVSAASDLNVVVRDLATPAGRERVPQLTIDQSFSVDQPRPSKTELLNDNRSYAGSGAEPSRESQTERTIAGAFSADHTPSSLEELSHSNRSSDLSVSIDSDNKASQELGASVHDNRSHDAPASAQ